MARTLEIEAPTIPEIVRVLKSHPLVRLREKVNRAFIVGSFAQGLQTERSDVDVLLEVAPRPGETAGQMEERYRQALRAHFMRHNIRGVADDVHPQWAERRVDIYFTYDADTEARPKIQLHKLVAVPLPAPQSSVEDDAAARPTGG